MKEEFIDHQRYEETDVLIFFLTKVKRYSFIQIDRIYEIQ